MSALTSNVGVAVLELPEFAGLDVVLEATTDLEPGSLADRVVLPL